MSFNPKKYIWTEGKRPKTVEDMVDCGFKNKILTMLKQPEKIPHIIAVSKTPGTGKTSLGYIIARTLGCDVLVLNSSDDRKIEVIREKIKEFAITQSSQPGKRRFIHLDEFDGMLKASQDALRNLMETYQHNVIFFLTANNVNRIIEPIKSRCLVIDFSYPDKKEVKEYLKKICNDEELPYDDEGIDTLISMNYPSIRNCVLVLQDLHTMGKSVKKENIKASDEVFDILWSYVKDGKWQDIKKAILASDVDPREVNSHFWLKAVEEENIKAIQITCRNEKDIATGADPKVVFVTSIIELCK